MKKLMFLFFVITGCTNSVNNSTGNSSANNSVYKEIEVSNLSVATGVEALPDDLIFADTSPSSNSSTAVLTLKNSSSLPVNIIISLSVPSNGFSIKTNRCSSSVPAKGSCQITLQFSSRGQYTGTIGASLTINTTEIGLSARILNQPDPDTGVPDLRLVLSSPFQTVNGSSTRTLTITNLGTGTAKEVSANLPADYSISINRCPSSLKPNASCTMQLYYKNYRTSPVPPTPASISIVASNALTPVQIDLKSGQAITDVKSIKITSQTNNQLIDSSSLVSNRLLVTGNCSKEGEEIKVSADEQYGSYECTGQQCNRKPPMVYYGTCEDGSFSAILNIKNLVSSSRMKYNGPVTIKAQYTDSSLGEDSIDIDNELNGKYSASLQIRNGDYYYTDNSGTFGVVDTYVTAINATGLANSVNNPRNIVNGQRDFSNEIYAGVIKVSSNANCSGGTYKSTIENENNPIVFNFDDGPEKTFSYKFRQGSFESECKTYTVKYFPKIIPVISSITLYNTITHAQIPKGNISVGNYDVKVEATLQNLYVGTEKPLQFWRSEAACNDPNGSENGTSVGNTYIVNDTGESSFAGTFNSSGGAELWARFMVYDARGADHYIRGPCFKSGYSIN